MRKAKTYQGNPCENGHTERYVSSLHCVVCQAAYSKKWYAKTPEKQQALSIKWIVENKKKHNAYNKKYKIENSKLYAYYAAKRRANIKRQTPPWADLEKIKEIYLSCPDGYDVDHIHPLSKGGLHIHWNLEAIPMHDNRSKGAKLL